MISNVRYIVIIHKADLYIFFFYNCRTKLVFTRKQKVRIKLYILKQCDEHVMLIIIVTRIYCRSIIDWIRHTVEYDVYVCRYNHRFFTIGNDASTSLSGANKLLELLHFPPAARVHHRLINLRILSVNSHSCYSIMHLPRLHSLISGHRVRSQLITFLFNVLFCLSYAYFFFVFIRRPIRTKVLRFNSATVRICVCKRNFFPSVSRRLNYRLFTFVGWRKIIILSLSLSLTAFLCISVPFPMFDFRRVSSSGSEISVSLEIILSFLTKLVFVGQMESTSFVLSP